MHHLDDIGKFSKKYKKDVKERVQALADEKFAIEAEISTICREYKIPEWEYRRYLRGHYESTEEFIKTICTTLKCANSEIMIKHAEYTLQCFEKKPDAEFIKTCEEHGLENIDDLFVKAKVNTIDIMLTAQSNIKKNLRSNNIVVQMKTTELVVKMLGNQMLIPNMRKDEREEATKCTEERIEDEPSNNATEASDRGIKNRETTVKAQVTFNATTTTDNDQ